MQPSRASRIQGKGSCTATVAPWQVAQERRASISHGTRAQGLGDWARAELFLHPPVPLPAAAEKLSARPGRLPTSASPMLPRDSCCKGTPVVLHSPVPVAAEKLSARPGRLPTSASPMPTTSSPTVVPASPVSGSAVCTTKAYCAGTTCGDGELGIQRSADGQTGDSVES